MLSLLEKARGAKFVINCVCVAYDLLVAIRQLTSSLEGEVDIVLSDLMDDNRFVHTLRREGNVQSLAF